MIKFTKFKAWDKTEKDFIYFTNKEGLNNWCDDKYQKLNINTILQFTGFYDSTQFQELGLGEQAEWLKSNKVEDWRGKELYELDIVEEVSFKKYTYVIKKENGSLKMFHLNGMLWGTMERGMELAKEVGFVFKLIGNELEIPELLKKERI